MFPFVLESHTIQRVLDSSPKEAHGGMGNLHCLLQGAVSASRAFVRVAGHSLGPSGQSFAGATLRRDVVSAESFERQGDL
jgi:hypothetical protein